MRFGYIQVYNEATWIDYAIDQAAKLCDRALIMEGAQYTNFPNIPERSNDGTLDIISDKRRQYPNLLQVMNTTRVHKKYRINQCSNFNHALSICRQGDYFIVLDADEFYADSCIDEMNRLMRENKVETIYFKENSFAFSFRWIVSFGKDSFVPVIVKKVEGFHFAPTLKRINAGERSVSIDGFNRFHYKWLKPKARLMTRMRTSMQYKGMASWLDDAWQNVRLEENIVYKSYSSDFTLHRYDGEHSSLLASHPWRHIEDIRRI